MSDISPFPASFTSLGSTQHVRIICLSTHSASLKKKLTSSILTVCNWFASYVMWTPHFHTGIVRLSIFSLSAVISQPWASWASLCTSAKHCHFNFTVCHSPAHNANHKAASSSKFRGTSAKHSLASFLPRTGPLQKHFWPSQCFCASQPECLCVCWLPKGFWSIKGAIVCPKSPCRIVAGYNQIQNLFLLGKTPWTYWSSYIGTGPVLLSLNSQLAARVWSPFVGMSSGPCVKFRLLFEGILTVSAKQNT